MTQREMWQRMMSQHASPVHVGPAERIPLNVGDNVVYYDRNYFNPWNEKIARMLCEVVAITTDNHGWEVSFYHLRCYDPTFNRIYDTTICPDKYTASVADVEIGKKFVKWEPSPDDYDELIGYPEYVAMQQRAAEAEQENANKA